MKTNNRPVLNTFFFDEIEQKHKRHSLFFRIISHSFQSLNIEIFSSHPCIVLR